MVKNYRHSKELVYIAENGHLAVLSPDNQPANRLQIISLISFPGLNRKEMTEKFSNYF